MKKYKKGWIAPECLVGETPKAYCFTARGRYGYGDRVWIPKSQTIIEEPNERGIQYVYVTKWWYIGHQEELYCKSDIEWLLEQGDILKEPDSCCARAG